jgi:methionyl-tRNA synthetase
MPFRQFQQNRLKKDSVHYFFDLANFSDMLRDWTKVGICRRKSATNWLNGWMVVYSSGIFRDAPYFGFEILMRLASIFMSGWMRPSVTWPALKTQR